ncbi:MAG: AI-2E family transporter [Alphaproteobacteria bacterium]|nr:AI-2E family transporter [Alphaproteobacteria bacterium]
MSVRGHCFFWGVAFAGFIAFVFVFKSVLLPFVLGAAIAYLLNPLVGGLGRIGIARGPAGMMILGGFFLLLFVFLAVISPVLYKQVLQLAKDFPGYVDQLLLLLAPLSQKFSEITGQEAVLDFDLKALLNTHGGQAINIAGEILKRLGAGGQAALDMLSVLVFTPLVAYFLIKEWVKISVWVEGMLPKDHKGTIQDLLSQIDTKISGFVRGQISVAVFLGVAYAVALTIAGLKYGFLIGLSAGLLSIIPMVGSAVGLIVSVAVAWFQSGDLMFVAIIGGIFLAGQLIEGNFLTPKLVGESVGMHPLWVFFALLAGGSLFGILGMLLAVPVAAVAGVLLAFSITQYKRSVYYFGQSGADDEGAQQEISVRVADVPVDVEPVVVSDEGVVSDGAPEADGGAPRDG